MIDVDETLEGRPISYLRISRESLSGDSIAIAVSFDDDSGGIYVAHPKRYRRGDVNSNGLFDATDIDAITSAINAGQYVLDYDFDQDSDLDQDDRSIWIEELANTYFGDADLNGLFTRGISSWSFRPGSMRTRRLATPPGQRETGMAMAISVRATLSSHFSQAVTSRIRKGQSPLYRSRRA